MIYQGSIGEEEKDEEGVRGGESQRERWNEGEAS